MDSIFFIYLWVMFLGFMDFWEKGRVPFYTLPPFKQHWSWHILFFAIFSVLLFYLSWAQNNPWILLGFLLYINEDAFYYIYKYIYYDYDSRKTYWNSWIGIWKSKKSYWITVVIINAVYLLLWWFLV